MTTNTILIIIALIGMTLAIFVCGIVVYFISKIRGGAKAIENEDNSFWIRLLVAIGQAIDKTVQVAELGEPPMNLVLKHSSFKKEGLKSFYYLDKGQIENLFPQVSDELIRISVEATTSTGSETEGNLGLPNVAQIKQGHVVSEELKSTFRAHDLTLATKYLAIERHLLNSSELAIGLEDSPQLDHQTNAFTKDCNNLRTKYGFSLSNETVASHQQNMRRDEAMEHVEFLVKRTGFVALKIGVNVAINNEAEIILTYDHEINKYFKNSDPKLVFALKCSGKNLTESGKHAFAFGTYHNVTIIAKISSWNPEKRWLMLSPIAVY